MKRLTLFTATLMLISSIAAIASAETSIESSDDDAQRIDMEFPESQFSKALLIANFFAEHYIDPGGTDERAPDTIDPCVGSEDETVCKEDLLESARDDLTDTIVMLRVGQPSIGWGALYKLMQIAAARGISIDDLLNDLDTDGNDEFGFGELRKSLDESQLAILENTPRNLGQLKKLARENREEPDALPKKTKDKRRNKDG
ncbi:MAG: hypothetical protein M3132_09000 [Actinomycetia bacterium]|nr:hypothetical protein [Actinomycetes bacterium]